MKRKILCLVLTIFMFMSSLMTTSAAPQSVTFNSRKLSGVNIQSGSSSNYKTVSTGNATVIAFCLNKSLKSPSNGATLTFKEKITDAGYVYIFENGYAGTWNTTLLGSGMTNDQKYYATQLAIWMYQGKLSSSNLNQNHPEVKAAIKLYDAAKKAKAEKNYIDIKSSDTTMFSDDTYYKSTLMAVDGNGYKNYKVTLVNATGSAEIVTTDGKVYKSGASLAAGTKFYIRIPKAKIYSDMNITVQVDATAKVNAVYKYTTADSAYQDVGIMMAETVSLSDKIKLNLVEDETYTVSIIKKDSVTGKALAGATLVVKDANGKVVDTWVSTTSAHVIDELEPGLYTLEETKAPKGYVLNKTPIRFTIVKGGDTEKVITFYNTPETPKTGSIKISKQDITTKKELPGATLTIKDANGTVIAKWVSTNEPHYVTGLKPGKYYLTETIAPAGYDLSTETIEFSINEDGKPSKELVVMYNAKTPEKTGSVKISKQDITTKKELPGATLTIKDENGNVITEWVSTDTPHYVTGLKPGKYQLIETTSPKGYGLSEEVIEFTIDKDGKPSQELIIMYNSPIPETADINLTLIFAGFIATISLGAFSIYKLIKQQ